MTTFYEQITPIHDLIEITNPHHYHPVPRDWLIALTDVQNSTDAIVQGRYKEVNAIAAASITAILNAVEGLDIPFVFGGDGATILVPAHLEEVTHQALAATRQLAIQQFNLNLRIGCIPVAEVLDAGYDIQVAKLFVSENFQQAIFSGGGLTVAEEWLKEDRYKIPDDVVGNADFSGFECRWNAIPTPQEENVTLIVKALSDTPAEQQATYTDVLHNIENIYGDRDERHPLRVSNLSLTFNPNKLSIEARIRNRERNARRIMRMMRGSFKAGFAMRFDIQGWGRYKKLLVEATDNEKFDDTLRMLIAGTPQQRKALENYLHKQHQSQRVVYGLHIARASLVTCIIFDYFGRQVHFVDGTEGGYALAARQMKAQLADL